MIIRNGFVSNSSSMSFTVSVYDYDSVFSLARRMLDIIVMLDEQDEWQGSDEWISHIKSVRKKLDDKERGGMDPNTPVVIPSCNYESYIVRIDHEYLVDSCNNHKSWQDLEG